MQNQSIISFHQNIQITVLVKFGRREILWTTKTTWCPYSLILYLNICNDLWTYNNLCKLREFKIATSISWRMSLNNEVVIGVVTGTLVVENFELQN